MVRKEEGESWLSPDAMFEFGSLFRTCCGISSNQTYSAMELKAISDRKHNHKHGERIGIVKRRAPPPSKEQHRSTKPVYERADITAGFIKAPAAEEEDDLSQAWITTGGDIFILPCCAPSSLPGMAISEIKTRTGTQTSKKHADSKKDHGLQKARDVMEHKQRVLANLNRSNHARPMPSSWDMDTPDLNNSEEEEEEEQQQQRRRRWRGGLDARVEEVKRKFRAACLASAGPLPHNNTREHHCRHPFLSLSHNSLHPTPPPPRRPRSPPSPRRPSEASPSNSHVTAMERVEQWVQAASKAPTVVTTPAGSGLGRHDIVTL